MVISMQELKVVSVVRLKVVSKPGESEAEAVVCSQRRTIRRRWPRETATFI